VWPWEHLAVGYIAVSVLFRTVRVRVNTGHFLAVVLGSQFPDLVDKPLAWAFGVLPSGTTLTHSVFVAFPLCLSVWLVCTWRGYGRIGFAFALAYLLHLPADVLYGTITVGNPPSVEIVLWPLVSKPSGSDPIGLLGETLYYARRYVHFLSRPEAVRYVLIECALLLTTALLWFLDGRPGFELVGVGLEKLSPYH